MEEPGTGSSVRWKTHGCGASLSTSAGEVPSQALTAFDEQSLGVTCDDSLVFYQPAASAGPEPHLAGAVAADTEVPLPHRRNGLLRPLLPVSPVSSDYRQYRAGPQKSSAARSYFSSAIRFSTSARWL